MPPIHVVGARRSWPIAIGSPAASTWVGAAGENGPSAVVMSSTALVVATYVAFAGGFGKYASVTMPSGNTWPVVYVARPQTPALFAAGGGASCSACATV